ncbi:hypothetical protein VTN77DRAFT_6913 [Rasamsonia byssochlamydoides]|uniref:uncharacterized protein n=1 Tax=Rasamsonia byssochlamydoides TaxID=89139 RepID=UPI0037423018
MHTSYAASGIRSFHEDLVASAQVVIVCTADAGRNAYQYGFTRYVGMLCASHGSGGKQFIAVAVSSPFDLLEDPQIPTFLCTYDYTSLALQCLPNSPER